MCKEMSLTNTWVVSSIFHKHCQQKLMVVDVVYKYKTIYLTYFQPIFHFSSPWKDQKTFDFMIFSGGNRSETVENGLMLELKVNFENFEVRYEISMVTKNTLVENYYFRKQVPWHVNICKIFREIFDSSCLMNRLVLQIRTRRLKICKFN